MSETWTAIPLRNLIVSILRKRHGVILNDELNRAVRKEWGKEPSRSEMNAALMQLEINGIVHVSQITKTKRRIEIIKDGLEFLAVDED
ncbi:MAG: hypothetical protein GF309_07455 [Candidatus Lokiarchaeota archaeon]|jgi:hypothetical protein|nr:hypothetical protein [Candidatus Lokiarchaeota archaeon]